MALQSGLPFLGSDLGGKPLGTPSLQFSVACLEVVDEEGKPPSFNYLFYELPLPEFPYKVNFYVANGWCNGKGSFVQRMKLLKPDRRSSIVDTAESGQQTFQLTDTATPFMAVNWFQEIPFEAPGVYWFQIFLDDKMVLEYPMTVRQAAPKP